MNAQFEFLIQVRDKLSETHDAINTIRNLKQQIEEWQRRAAAQKDSQSGAGEFGPAATRLLGSLTAIEEELIQPRAQVGSDTRNFPAKLNAKLASLTAVIASADWIPTRGSYQVFEKLASEIDAQLRQLQQVVDSDSLLQSYEMLLNGPKKIS
ncbi:MAG: hypothetical protein ACR2PL_23675 [Dehalococcoidia bacterium]